MKIHITDAMHAREVFADYDHVISLVGPDLKYELNKMHDRHFLRVFHDVEYPLDTTELHGTEWEVEDLILPTKEMCADILHFGREIDWDNESVLIHCHAGRSRSAAALIALLAQYGWSPTKAVSVVGNMRYNMLPNRWMTRMFDDLLDENGALVKAVERWYDDYTGPGMLLRNKLGGWEKW